MLSAIDEYGVLLCVHSTYLQKEQLLSNSDRLRRTGDMIEESYQITIDSERVGMSVMDDLNRDREKIQQSQRRVSSVEGAEEIYVHTTIVQVIRMCVCVCSCERPMKTLRGVVAYSLG